MSLSRTTCSSIANDDTLAFFSTDGVLRVWDVKSGVQRHQYLPSSHLTATFTCLAWELNQGSKKKREKDENSKKSSQTSSEFLALGTAVGEIVLYNALNGELVMKYSGGHADRVNCIAWSNQTTFYSCSNDQHLVEWSINTEKYKSKWKAGRREVYSLRVGPHSNTLLTAGKMILLWDLKTKKILQKFSGHTSPVLSLQYLNVPKRSSGSEGDNLKSVCGSYFLSLACEDRAMSAWQISKSATKKVANCSFSLPCEGYFVDVLPSNTPDQPVWLLAATEDEQIVLFKHMLNGPSEKPLNPFKSMKVVTDEARPLKLVCASFNRRQYKNNKSVVVTIAYGSSFQLVFEQINIEKHSEPDIVLIRADPSKSRVFLERDNCKLLEPSKDKNVTAIVPGAVGHSGNLSKKSRKRHVPINERQLTMEERLQARSADVTLPAVTSLRSDSYAVLLSQGLQSKDHSILNQVLQHSNDGLIKNTVSQLAINYVIPLIEELTERLQGNPNKCLIFSKWLKATLCHHSSFLTTLPDIIPLLNKVYQLIEARNRIHERLPSMQGKLEMLLSQVDSKKDDDLVLSSQSGDALYVYDEDSSDDFEDLEGITVDEEMESANEWDDSDSTGEV